MQQSRLFNSESYYIILDSPKSVGSGAC
uniref:Uncharacterized protein n=1 Tax=Anguilla anguilla TaxID=7936 RepID=A0A0E9TH05_ANGAN